MRKMYGTIWIHGYYFKLNNDNNMLYTLYILFIDIGIYYCFGILELFIQLVVQSIIFYLLWTLLNTGLLPSVLYALGALQRLFPGSLPG